ncbi:MAG: rod shape-determining protein MreC [Gammaproteobacteria bacterium]
MLFKEGPSTGIRLTVLAFVSVLLMVLDHRFAATSNLRSALSLVVDPIRYLVNLPTDIYSWASDSLTSHNTLEEENQTLRIRNQLLEAKLQKYSSLMTENNNLRALLKSVDKHEDQFQHVLVAEILSVDMDPFRRQIVINKGTSDDVYVNQPIVGANGVMGKVITVGPLSSTVMLITDPSHSLPVQVNRNGVRAIAVGDPRNNELSIIHQPNNANIKLGDLLVTSGLGCVFPAGYPVGKVIKINTNPSLPFAEILVKPTANLDRGREVLLVWPSPHQREVQENACSGPGGGKHHAGK